MLKKPLEKWQVAACIRGKSPRLSPPNIPLKLNPKTLSQGPVLSNDIFTIWLPRMAKSGHYYIFCVFMGQSVHCTIAGLNSMAVSGKSEQRLGEQGHIQTFFFFALPWEKSLVLHSRKSELLGWRCRILLILAGFFLPFFFFLFGQDLFENDHKR